MKKEENEEEQENCPQFRKLYFTSVSLVKLEGGIHRKPSVQR